MNKIYLCQTCSGRKWQAIETVSHNINSIKAYYRMEKPSVNYFHDWPMCSMCIVDYNCKDNITEYLLNEHAEDIVNGFLSIFKVENEMPWHMARVKNIAMRMGIGLGGNYVVSLDIDNFIMPREIRLLASLNRNGTSYHGINSFYDGSCGRIGCSSSSFLRCRGFREDAPICWHSRHRPNKKVGYFFRHC
ncbi:MAG: hypothetical protein GW914_00925 [Candidatus Aenigmarchaeota archaeon]|nr:hypothetical protein [Candidatus Aenigmarchaeota archaeon]